jgi:hypothetical protein
MEVNDCRVLGGARWCSTRSPIAPGEPCPPIHRPGPGRQRGAEPADPGPGEHGSRLLAAAEGLIRSNVRARPDIAAWERFCTKVAASELGRLCLN